MKSLSFGEILWDTIDSKKYLGGAPLNIAAHLAKLKNNSWIISAIGHDELGKKAMAEMNKIGINTSLVQFNAGYPTGHVTVQIDKLGKPQYDIHKNVAWDNIEPLEIKERFDCFCFGTLSQRNKVSRKSLETMLSSLKTKEIFYDVNLRQNYYTKEIIKRSLSFSSIAKLNLEEAKKLSLMLFDEILSENAFAKRLSQEFSVRIVIITRGSRGVAIWYKNDFLEFPGIKVKVKDTVGAGDAFSAAFLHGYFKTKGDITRTVAFATKLGAYVATRSGAIPKYDSFAEKL